MTPEELRAAGLIGTCPQDCQDDHGDPRNLERPWSWEAPMPVQVEVETIWSSRLNSEETIARGDSHPGVLPVDVLPWQGRLMARIASRLRTHHA